MASKRAKSVEFNRPSFVALLFILGALTGGVIGIVGLLLAYAWSGRSPLAWEGTHYVYLMRSFWLGLVANLAGLALIWVGLVYVGAGLLSIVALWSLVRAIVSFANAIRRDVMPDPLTYLF